MHLFLTFSAALGIARTSSALLSLARKFVRLVRPIRSPFYSLKGISVNFLIFSAALGIARTSSGLHSLARKFVKFVGKKTGKFVLKSAISRQAKANKFSLVFWLNEIVGFRRLFWKNVANYALFSCFIGLFDISLVSLPQNLRHYKCYFVAQSTNALCIYTK